MLKKSGTYEIMPEFNIYIDFFPFEIRAIQNIDVHIYQKFRISSS